MKYAYIGEETRRDAERIIERHNVVAITGECANGNVELGVPSNLPDRAINLYIKGLERGRL